MKTPQNANQSVSRLARDRDRSRERRTLYVPLDTLLARMPLRVLRVLRRFRGWTEPSEIAVALDIPPREQAGAVGRYSGLERNNMDVAIGQLVGRGLVERRTEKGLAWYRITDDGSRHIDESLALAEPRLTCPEVRPPAGTLVTGERRATANPCRASCCRVIPLHVAGTCGHDEEG